MTAGAVQLMKLANRAAQRRIASGAYPEYEAVVSGLDRSALLAEPDPDGRPA